MNALALDLMLQTELPAATRGSPEAYGRIVHACPNTVTARVQIKGSIDSPSEWWRLTHPSELGSMTDAAR